MLHKRWVASLATPFGELTTPNMAMVKAIVMARNLWRKKRMSLMEDHFDRGVHASVTERDRRSKARTFFRVSSNLAKKGRRTRPWRVSMA